MAKIIRIFLALALAIGSVTFETTAWAQGAPAAETKSDLTGTRRQVATIIFSGLAGAILGLSTLSFYGRPQDKLNNVAIGGALGIIAGTIYTTYKSATRPYDAYDMAEADLAPMRDRLHDQQTLARGPIFTMQWQF